jgi:class 3 adenylate cyclase
VPASISATWLIDGDDLMGDGVNIASPLAGLADPDGICISGAACEQVRDKLDLPFTDSGDQTVKNVDRPVRVQQPGWGWRAIGAPANAGIRGR